MFRSCTQKVVKGGQYVELGYFLTEATAINMTCKRSQGSPQMPQAPRRYIFTLNWASKPIPLSDLGPYNSSCYPSPQSDQPP